MSTVDSLGQKAGDKLVLGKNGGNLGGLPVGGSILMLGTQIRAVIRDLLDRDLDEGLLVALR